MIFGMISGYFWDNLGDEFGIILDDFGFILG